jgi:hypothetical protein
MAIKLDEKSKTFTVTHSKRHPVTRVPCTLRRTKIKTKAEANRVYAMLILKVEDRLKEALIPRWKNLVNDYSKFLYESDVTVKTADS